MARTQLDRRCCNTKGALRVLFAVVALVLAACSAGATVAGAESSAPVQRGVTACTKSETRAALVSFVRAFNAGDYRRLNRLFVARSWFGWYSSGTPGVRSNDEAHQRGTLISYFRDRHTQRDRFKLMSFRFTGNSNGFGNFTWKTERSATDFRDGAWFVADAKGAALCQGADARFIVMSIGSPVP
jgi:hypothetical protein